jgi:hypothetical protein
MGFLSAENMASRKASASACSRAVFMSPGARPSASTVAAGAK